MSPPPAPSAASSSSSAPIDNSQSLPVAPRRRPSSQYSRRSIASSFRSPPASLAPASSLASPALTLHHSTTPRRHDSGSESSSGSSSMAEMKRALEADEARLRLVLERREHDKGKGRAGDVVGVPTEFGGEGGGEAGLYLGKRRKLSVSTPSTPNSSGEVADPTKTTGTGEQPAAAPAAHADLPPDPPLTIPPNSAPYSRSHPSWFGSWTRSAAGVPPSFCSSAPAEAASTDPSLVQPAAARPPAAATAETRAAAPAPPTGTSDVATCAAGMIDQRSSGSAAPHERSSSSVAAHAFAWLPKPVVSTVASLPVVRSYAAPPPALTPTVPAPSVEQRSLSVEVQPSPTPEVSGLPAEPMAAAAVHEGHLPGAPGPAFWFWSSSAASPAPAPPSSTPTGADSSSSEGGSISIAQPSAGSVFAPTPASPETEPATRTVSSKTSWFSLRSTPPGSNIEGFSAVPQLSTAPPMVPEEPSSEKAAEAAVAQEASAGQAGAVAGWWGYVPFVGGAKTVEVGSRGAFEQADPSAEAPSASASAVVPNTTSQTSTSSYLAPLSWIYSSGTARPTEPASPSVEPLPPVAPPPTSPQPAPSSARRMPSPARAALSSSSPAPSPSSYASWIAGVAGKAAQPRTSSNSLVKTIGLGADVGEVMDIDDDAPGMLSTSAASKDAIVSVARHSPPSSVRTQKSSSFFFSSVSKSPSSSSLAGQGVKLPPAADKTTAIASRRPSSVKVAVQPNLVLPTFDDVFQRPPRSVPPPAAIPRKGGLARKTLGALGTILAGDRAPVAADPPPTPSQERIALGRERGRLLPKPLTAGAVQARRRTPRRVVVLGIHGWFPTGLTRRIAGEPTGTSHAFASRMRAALDRYFAADSQGALGSVTVIPLEGDGTVVARADRLFDALTGRDDWVKALRGSTEILVATHSQGNPVSTLLLERLYAGGFIRSPHNEPAVFQLDDILQATSLIDQEYPKVAVLGLCGVHLGPLTYLSQSSVVGPWIRTFENAAASELFAFQDTESATSQRYIAALSSVLDHGCKMLYVASLNDQVVPVYSAIFSAAQHPNILRVLHIDGAAHDVTDFVTSLIIFCLQLRNAGLDDGGLVAHLSESVAHGLTGVGHSTAYAEDTSYSLAIRYLFESSDSTVPQGALQVDEFLASEQRNSYDIPWILRGIMEDPLVLELFGTELAELRSAFDRWIPQSQKMKDLRRKLEPLRPKTSRRVLAKSPLAAEIDVSSTAATPPAVKQEPPQGRSRL